MSKHHDKGEKDASEGKNDPPHDRFFWEHIIGPSQTDQDREDIKDYKEGQANHKKQTED